MPCGTPSLTLGVFSSRVTPSYPSSPPYPTMVSGMGETEPPSMPRSIRFGNNFCAVSPPWPRSEVKPLPVRPHGAGTHSIEGKKGQENAEHIAQDIWGYSAFMLSKGDSYCTVDLGDPSQNFFRAPPARSAGKPMEHSYRYRLRFGTRFGCQNFRASFQAFSKTSKRFSIGFLYDELHRSWFPNPTPQQRNTQKDKHDCSFKLEM